MRLSPIPAALLLLAAPAVAQVTRITGMVDGSGTIATAGASQQVFDANPRRGFLFCQNPNDATETLFLNYGAAAKTNGGSVELAPGGSVSFLGVAIPTQSINVTAATAGHRFVCKAGEGINS